LSDQPVEARRAATGAPRFSAPVRFALWGATRVAQVVALFIVGWVIVAVGWSASIGSGLGSWLGLGIFVALPLTVTVSAVAWILGASSLAAGPTLRRTVMAVAIVVEFVAVVFLNLAWTPNGPLVITVDVLIAIVLTAVLPWAHRRASSSQ